MATLRYDPVRLGRLHLLARDAASALSSLCALGGRGSDAAAVRRLRRVVEGIDGQWLPAILRASGSTALTAWSATAPPPLPDDLGSLATGELLGLAGAYASTPAPSVATGPVVAAVPVALLQELANRWDTMTPAERGASVIVLLMVGATGSPALPGNDESPWSMLTEVDRPEIAALMDDPAFRQTIIHVVASRGSVPPDLQPLVDAVAMREWPAINVGRAGITDASVLRGLGVDPERVPDRETAEAFVAATSAEVHDDLDALAVLDTSEFVLAGSLLASSDSGSWGDLTAFYGERSEIFYAGGGFVRGPDGHDYSIVIPTVVTPDGTYTADDVIVAGYPSVSDLAGESPGWEVIGYASGVTPFEQPVDGVSSLVIVGGAVVAGGYGPPPPPNATLAQVTGTANGPPRFTSAPTLPASVVGLPNIDGRVMAVAAGIEQAISLDHQTSRAYQVVFETNTTTGARRARVTIYQVNGGDAASITPNHLYVTESGQLRQQGVSFAHPFVDESVAIAATTVPVPPLHFSGHDFDSFPVARPLPLVAASPG